MEQLTIDQIELLKAKYKLLLHEVELDKKQLKKCHGYIVCEQMYRMDLGKVLGFIETMDLLGIDKSLYKDEELERKILN